MNKLRWVRRHQGGIRYLLAKVGDIETFRILTTDPRTGKGAYCLTTHLPSLRIDPEHQYRATANELKELAEKYFTGWLNHVIEHSGMSYPTSAKRFVEDAINARKKAHYDPPHVIDATRDEKGNYQVLDPDGKPLKTAGIPEDGQP